jgi:hypothetical protein
MHQLKNFPLDELKYLEKAVNVVIRCRNVLKYTYALGYFLKREEDINILEL